MVKNDAIDNVIFGGEVITDGQYGIRYQDGSNGGLIEATYVEGQSDDTVGISISYSDDVTIELVNMSVLSDAGIVMKGSQCNVFDVHMY